MACLIPIPGPHARTGVMEVPYSVPALLGEMGADSMLDFGAANECHENAAAAHAMELNDSNCSQDFAAFVQRNGVSHRQYVELTKLFKKWPPEDPCFPAVRGRHSGGKGHPGAAF